MAYEHGVRISEQATSLLPTVEVSAGIPVIIGTAAVNMADPENVNKPKLCYSYAEAVEAFGHVPAELDPESGLKKFRFSISELIQSAFSLYGVCPIIAINVLDPAKHKCTVSATSVRLDPKTGQGVVEETGILPAGLTLSSESRNYSVNDDFVLSFDDDGFLVITSLKNEDGDFRCQTGTDITLFAEKLDPSKVTEEDIIGRRGHRRSKARAGAYLGYLPALPSGAGHNRRSRLLGKSGSGGGNGRKVRFSQLGV